MYSAYIDSERKYTTYLPTYKALKKAFQDLEEEFSSVEYNNAMNTACDRKEQAAT